MCEAEKGRFEYLEHSECVVTVVERAIAEGAKPPEV